MKVEEHCVLVVDCPHSTPVWTNSGVLVFRSTNVRNGRLDLSQQSFTSDDEYAKRVRRAVPSPGDIIITREAPMGEVAIIPEGVRGCLGQRMVLLRPNPNRTDARFLLYALMSPAVQAEIKTHEGTGSTVSNLRIPSLEALEIPSPALPEQHAIAHILGTLDDKIELNRRVNEMLEAIAQALFKSWFVDVAQDGLPDGWREGTLGEVAENPRRGIKPDAINSATPYIGLEHMPRRCIALSDWDDAVELGSNKFEFKQGEVLFGKLRPYFHKVGVAPINGVCSTDILVVAPREPAWFGFVLGHVSSVEFVNHTDAGSTGTKMPRTDWQDMARYEVALPPKPLAAAFTERIRPLVERIIANIHESRTLAALRDTLLPKLISGELRVPMQKLSETHR